MSAEPFPELGLSGEVLDTELGGTHVAESSGRTAVPPRPGRIPGRDIRASRAPAPIW